MDFDDLLNVDISTRRTLEYEALNGLSKERQGLLLVRIKKYFRKRYLSFRCGLRIAIKYVPVGVKMLQKTNLSDAVFFWQQCIEGGFMSGTLEEKLVNPDIGFTVEECVSIGLREDLASGWRFFYSEVSNS